MASDHGDQLPLVLIPGMMCDARLFAPQIAALSQTRRVITLLPTDHDSMADLARDLLAKAPSRFALCGLSMGGIVAMEMLRQAPNRVARLALLDTNSRAEMPATQDKRAPQMAAVRQGHLARIMREEMIPNYAHPDHPTPELDALALDMARDLGSEVFLRQSRALRDRPDQTETLERFTGPALILMGQGDRLCPQDRHAQMARAIPHARYVILPDTGHLSTLQAPQQVTSALKIWLRS
ncbi:MAG: alpha/beta fold hydrolase [Rhodobacteraceae bacterium]|nr:alpha/beta fold hydrolase [Paracoccaceae bacterium]